MTEISIVFNDLPKIRKTHAGWIINLEEDVYVKIILHKQDEPDIVIPIEKGIFNDLLSFM